METAVLTNLATLVFDTNGSIPSNKPAEERLWL
jgi:hypothetical protein